MHLYYTLPAVADIKIALLFIVPSNWWSVSLFKLAHQQLSKLIVDKDGSGSVWLIILWSSFESRSYFFLKHKLIHSMMLAWTLLVLVRLGEKQFLVFLHEMCLSMAYSRSQLVVAFILFLIIEEKHFNIEMGCQRSIFFLSCVTLCPSGPYSFSKLLLIVFFLFFNPFPILQR